VVETLRSVMVGVGPGAEVGDASHVEAPDQPPSGRHLLVVPADSNTRPEAWEPGSALVLEDTTEISLPDGRLPSDLPIGYHRLHGPDGPTSLIVSPRRCPSDPNMKAWGLTAQLYAARSSRSWGIGDLADLSVVNRWATGRGAAVVGLNPLHAPNPLPHQPDSPYSPSSRRFRDPLYLAIEDVPGASHLPDLDSLVAQGRALNAGELIDRDTSWALKRIALEAIWASTSESTELNARLDRYMDERGPDLQAWGTYCALTDHHGTAWPSWPTEHAHPDSPAIGAFAASRPGQVRFWVWLQMLLDDQLEASGAPSTVIADLAVGFAPDGFDAWQWQDLLATGVSIGAPPDTLARDGQDWGLPPFVPWKLRDVGYLPFASTLRSVLRHSRGLRIDHVMGLFRLFWVPPGRSAAEGAYVRFPATEMLDVLAIEATRAGALVVGEDLGTVPDGLRDLLGAAGILSTRLAWFTDGPPETWPRQAMAAVTTHDLPTIAGVWSGVDLEDQRDAGVTLAPDGDAEMKHRLRVLAGCDDAAPVEHVIESVHRRIGESPSMLVTATLDDLTGAPHRPNLPGTVDENPNWRRPLPVDVDDLDGHPLAETCARALSDRTDEPQNGG